VRRSRIQRHASRVRRITTGWLAAVLVAAIVHPAVQAASVPDFTLQLLDGKNVSLQDYRGKPVLLNFFLST